MLMRKCLLAMLILMLVIMMLILMLLNLNTGYADTDADLCIRIMSLCCILHVDMAMSQAVILILHVNIIMLKSHHNFSYYSILRIDFPHKCVVKLLKEYY